MTQIVAHMSAPERVGPWREGHGLLTLVAPAEEDTATAGLDRFICELVDKSGLPDACFAQDDDQLTAALSSRCHAFVNASKINVASDQAEIASRPGVLTIEAVSV